VFFAFYCDECSLKDKLGEADNWWLDLEELFRKFFKYNKLKEKLSNLDFLIDG